MVLPPIAPIVINRLPMFIKNVNVYKFTINISLFDVYSLMSNGYSLILLSDSLNTVRNSCAELFIIKCMPSNLSVKQRFEAHSFEGLCKTGRS